MNQLSKVKWIFAVIAVFFVSINLRPAITSVGPLLNAIMSDLNVTNTQMSLLTSIPVFCMGLFAPLAVSFQKRLGYKWSINVLLLGIGVATAARLFLSSFSAIMITSFIAGFCIAIISPMVNAYIKAKFASQFGLVIGVYSFAMVFGAMISGGLTGVFYEYFQNSWPAALSIWGILAIVAIIVWSVATPESETFTKVEEPILETRKPWKEKRIWTIMIFFGFQTSMFFSLTTWLSPMAMEQGMPLVTAGTVLTVMSIVQMIGNVTIPAILNKKGNVTTWLFGLIAVGLIGMFVLMIGAQWAIWTGVVILGISMSGLFPIGLMMPLTEARNEAEANSFSSMVLSGGFMMSAFAPLLIGAVYDVTASHLVSKWILVVIYIAMFLSITVYAKQLRRV